MATAKKQKGKTALTFFPGTETVPGAHAAAVVNVEVKCDAVQIGAGNIQNVHSTPTTNTDPVTDTTKNGAGLILVKGILLDKVRPVTMTILEEEVRRKLKEVNVRTFRELAGFPLKDFLIKNKEVFDTYSRKQNKLVKLRVKGQGIVEKEMLKINDCEQNEHKCMKDLSSHKGCHASPNESCEVDIVAKSDELNDEHNWTTVKRKIRNRACKKLTGACKESPGINSRNKRFNSTKFQMLLSKSEGNDILFIPCTNVYEQNKNRFMLDIVSMWNTPGRKTSYIVIGAMPGEMFGVKTPLQDDEYQNLFPNESFTTHPLFECLTVEYDSMLFCVVEISSSCGHTNPCFVKSDTTVGDLNITTGQLWCMMGGKPGVCSPTEPLFGEVFRWFLSPNSKCKEMPEMRNGETNTTETVVDMTPNKLIVEDIPISGTTFNFFWTTVKAFKSGHFALISGDIKANTKHLNAMAALPWICVYDFDVFSCSSGLLNVVQDSIEDQRHLKIRTWKDQPENISEHGTLWCFMRGRREMSDTRSDQKDGSIEDKNTWYREVRKGLTSNCEKLANFIEDYTVLTVVVLWPENEKLIPFICKFLDRMNESLASTPNIVLCLNNALVTNTGEARFKALCADFGNNVRVCHLPFEELSLGILNNVSQGKEKVISYELPKAEGHTASAITEKDATWLREDFEVLYLANPYKKTDDKDLQIQEDVNSFYKGDTLHWSSWYLFGSEQVDIERDVMKQLYEQVHSLIDEYKTSVLTLFHSPGSGGTTLAQRMLWKFHNTIPSVHLKLRSSSTLDELDRKVLFVHDKTDLPVLLLIDGEEESKVRCLSRRLKYSIILYVKRYPYRVPIVQKKYKVFLPGTVSSDEASRLALKFGERCDDRKKKALNKLSKDVQSKKEEHYLYEFGLTLHLHEFKGIVSYVEGYLQLDKNPTKELTPGQKCLGYLSLVYFYGQSSVPCQFFAALFKQAPNYLMTLEDFPDPIPHFVVYDKNESRKNNLRICHYIIAKEILEQLLSRHSTYPSKERTDTLGQYACRNLQRFCIDFIEYASKRKPKTGITATAISFILTKTFIFRDEKDMSENEEQVRRKPVLSKLMIDIPGGKPLFTERLKVLEKLAQSFPDDPNYHAHLGRFHAFCRPDEEHEAEKCFQKAIQLCEEKRCGKKDEDLEDGLKLSMMHIYHMYGIVKQRSVSKFTGRSQDDKVVPAPDDEFFERIKELVQIAIIACEYFTKSREITPDTHSVYNYAYTGEIQVRLQICDFVKRQFRWSKKSTIMTFLNSDADTTAKEFVKISIPAIENLILECYMDVELVNDDLFTLRKQVLWYNSLFKKQVLPIDSMPPEDGVSARRLKIAAKKLKFGNANNLNGIESIENEADLLEVVELYEENFNDIYIHGFQDNTSKKELDRDYRDWIYAIRHEQFTRVYSLEEVLIHVRKWYDQVHSPISTFYLFVVTGLLGIGTETVPGKTECLIDALTTKEELTKMNKLIIRPKYPREWLGNSGEGIKRLVSGNRHVGVCAEERDGTTASRSGLAVCKGTICPPNTNKVSGFIELDLDVQTVRVYYIPKRVDLEGNRFVGQRVEFNLAFSVHNGFEAYNVKLLKRHGCPKCNAKLEFTSADSTKRCRCDFSVSKDEMNEV